MKDLLPLLSRNCFDGKVQSRHKKCRCSIGARNSVSVGDCVFVGAIAMSVRQRGEIAIRGEREIVDTMRVDGGWIDSDRCECLVAAQGIYVTLEWQCRASGDPAVQTFGGVLRTHRDYFLPKDLPLVDLSANAMKRIAGLALAVVNAPKRGTRTTVKRQQRRMTIDQRSKPLNCLVVEYLIEAGDKAMVTRGYSS